MAQQDPILGPTDQPTISPSPSLPDDLLIKARVIGRPMMDFANKLIDPNSDWNQRFNKTIGFPPYRPSQAPAPGAQMRSDVLGMQAGPDPVTSNIAFGNQLLELLTSMGPVVAPKLAAMVGAGRKVDYGEVGKAIRDLQEGAQGKSKVPLEGLFQKFLNVLAPANEQGQRPQLIGPPAVVRQKSAGDYGTRPIYVNVNGQPRNLVNEDMKYVDERMQRRQNLALVHPDNINNVLGRPANAKEIMAFEWLKKQLDNFEVNAKNTFRPYGVEPPRPGEFEQVRSNAETFQRNPLMGKA